ncbi:MAG: protein-L-isoaspartate(D-aspartate) O-methyltransferase [Phycisphaerae bacterium]|nr:protein-L-isoaspartate(D-aspartate) O-methyltransferase [Phycisphaerae bacterium]
MSDVPDIERYAAERARMVSEQIERRGIRSPRVLDAFRWVPRERFMPPGAIGQAYDDGAFPIDCGQTISQPYMVACMTEQLALTGGERVLEIGTGSGYQAAILANLAAHVYSVEWHLRLMNEAADRVRGLGLTNVTYRCGDGSVGWAEYAPYDAIMVTAGAPSVPEALGAQLAEGGRLVVPVGDRTEQVLVRIVRRGGKLERDEGIRCRFVKLVGEAGWGAD